MQIIEHTGFGTRSAVLTFEKRGSNVRFVVVPMLHLGSPQFYRNVRKELQACDRIVVEGVTGHRTRMFTLAYRLAGKVRRSGLVGQAEGLDLSDLSDRFVRPDLTAAQFAHGWRGVKRGLRWMVLLGAPVVGLWVAIVGPRRALGDMTLDDLPTQKQEELAEYGESLDTLIIDERDRPLGEALIALAADQDQPCTVGVCWGAEHVRAVVTVLVGHLGYRIGNGTWITVFD